MAGPSSSLVKIRATGRLLALGSRRNVCSAHKNAEILLFISTAPRPNIFWSWMVAENGGKSHKSGFPGGTTSTWPQNSRGNDLVLCVVINKPSYIKGGTFAKISNNIQTFSWIGCNRGFSEDFLGERNQYGIIYSFFHDI